MPPVLVYQVDFAKGNLRPTVDVNSWGDMVLGGSIEGRDHTSDDGGLILKATRPTTYVGQPPGQVYTQGGASSAVYVVLPVPPPHLIPSARALPRASRLELHVEFDSPNAMPQEPVPTPPQVMSRRVNLGGGENDLPDAPPGPGNVPPWAVALRVKLDGNEIDQPDDAMINVTCQFHNTGVRLNDPNKAQDAKTNQSTDLDSPCVYNRWNATQFNLGFAYSGIQAGPAPVTHKTGDDLGYAVGSGFLEMVRDSPWFQPKYDRRLFSSTALSTSNESWIGALGVAVGTINYAGTMWARLKRFSVTMWATAAVSALADSPLPSNATSD